MLLVALAALAHAPRASAQQVSPRVGDAPGADAPTPPTLRVGVAGSEPFVIAREGALEGIAVDVWRAVALRAGLRFELVHGASVPSALEDLAAGRLDAVVGPVSITAERAERVRFTQPYYQSSLAILARAESRGFFRRLAPFVSRPFFVGLGVLLLVLTGVGALVWLAERRRNPEQFPRDPARGIGNGVWFALVTMTTVGYGDRAPVTSAGRVIAGVWMVLALLTASSLTASIASALTVAQLTAGAVETAEQLARRRVAVVRGTPAARFARRHDARVIEVADLAQAVEQVRSGRAAAVVFDRPQLMYHLQRHPDPNLVLSQARYMPQGYGFALRPDTTLSHALNVSLLQVEEAGQVQRIREEWVGHAADE